jgi:hypothetical protein
MLKIAGKDGSDGTVQNCPAKEHQASNNVQGMKAPSKWSLRAPEHVFLLCSMEMGTGGINHEMKGEKM